MAKESIESKFRKMILEKYPKLHGNKISIRNGERKIHVRFSNGCGVTSKPEFLSLFSEIALDFTSIQNQDFSKKYPFGGYVIWKGYSIGVLYGIAEIGNIETKKYVPDALGLSGYKVNDYKMFRNKIIDGINTIEVDTGIRECLISMIDTVEGKGLIKYHPFLKDNINIVKKDFGEVLAAYKYCFNGYEIEFPVNSNHPNIDFYADSIPISVKSPAGGGKVNLSNFKDNISQTTTTGKFLYSIATYNRNDFFKNAADLCPEVKILADWVGGTTRKDIKKYISLCSYDDHYNKMKSDIRFTLKNQTLGIPEDSALKSSEITPKELWAKGSLEPFDFTLNTIIHKFWGISHQDDITDIVSVFLNRDKFVRVDIKDLDIFFEEIPFENVKKWQTIYWSRATKAWHNWPCVEPVPEEK
jgi:hypothetical protein